MKRALPIDGLLPIFLISCLCLITMRAYSQESLNTTPSADKNYVITETYQRPFSSPPSSPTTDDLSQEIVYFDSFGRPIQQVHVKGNPAYDDIITPRAYDEFGRENKQYLPYASGSSPAGSYRANALGAQGSFYNSPPSGVVQIPATGGITPSYSQIIFEPSPLSRVLEQGAPGAAWQVDSSSIPGSGHTVKAAYFLNNSVSVGNLEQTRRVVKYHVNLTADYTPSLFRSMYYPADQLSVKVTKDENWTPSDGRAGTVEEYTGSDGRVVLSRTFNRTGSSLEMLSTYYVYDPYGNLTYVLPPASNPDGSTAPNASRLNNYCYQYKYDGRNRLVEKKLPGKGWEYLVYNELDQVVATQDHLQRARHEWTITKYDWQGRVVMTGLWNNNNAAISRSDLQDVIASQSTLWEERSSSGNGYTNLAWPTQHVTTTLTLNYYDRYDIPGLPASYEYTSASTMTLGLATASRTKVLNVGTGTSNMLWEVWYYDDKGQVIRQYKQHYKGGGTAQVNNYDLLTTTYTFTGQPVETIRRHYAGGSLSLTLRTRNTYDHAGRLKETWKQVGSADSVLLSRHSYNALGQLTQKELHKENTGTFAQQVVYDYTARGWLKSSEAALFKLELKYEDGATPQYNGNIAGQTFIRQKVSGTSETLTYSYSYDKVNRLLSGSLAGNKGKEVLTYDKMGNIQSLQRSGTTSTLVDNLEYNYSNNRLTWVYDSQGETSGSYQLADTTRYTYDANGNIKTRKNNDHPDRNINSIGYNILNQPRTITTPSGTITYIYDATGRKLRSVNGVPGQTRDYIDGIEYTGSTLELIHTEEGRIIKSGTIYEYQYFLKDHLGNNRVGFEQSTTLATTPNFSADYYPFGLQYQADKRQPSPNNNYLYNGKEVQNELAWYDYGARFYDPVIGRWGVVDPLAENHYNLNPYHYVMNNPMVFIDPLGLDTLKYDAFINDPSKVVAGDVIEMGEGKYTEVLEAVTVTASDEGTIHMPSREPYGGVLGNLDYFLFGGIENGIYYNRKGEPIGLAPIMGMPPNAGKFTSIRSMLQSVKGLRNLFKFAKGGSKLTVQFGKTKSQIEHVFRHTDALGLDRSLVQTAIQNHFKTVSSQVVTGKPLNQIIEVGGQRIQYTAFKLSDGTFNIGRIHGIK